MELKLSNFVLGSIQIYKFIMRYEGMAIVTINETERMKFLIEILICLNSRVSGKEK